MTDAAAPRLSPTLRGKLERVPVAALSGQLRKRGLNDVTIDGVHALTPGSRFVGTARTLRFVPHREDLFASHGGGQNAQKRAFDAVGEGEVIVIEARGETGSGTLGDILAIRAHARGAAAIVTDGGVRMPRPSPLSASPSSPPARTRPSSGVVTCRGRPTSPSAAAAPRSSRATSSSATATA